MSGPPFIFEYTDEYLVVKVHENQTDLFERYRTNIRTGLGIFSNIFHPNEKDIVIDDDDHFSFVLGRRHHGGYIIEGRLLAQDYSLILSPGIVLSEYHFWGSPYYRNIWSIIFNAVKNDIIIGNDEGQLPVRILDNIVNRIPNYVEMQYYAHSRITNEVAQALELKSDPQKKLDEYVRKRHKTMEEIPNTSLINLDIERYQYALSTMETMLSEKESKLEGDWQAFILDILPLIFPQYICSLEKVIIGKINDHDKIPDFVMIDNMGYVDVIEIKNAKRSVMGTEYRDNVVPYSEFSGVVSQIEMYILALVNNKESAKKIIQTKAESQLPCGMEVKILNPRGIIIMGHASDDAINRFGKAKIDEAIEVVRRQYSHIIDVISYDDLKIRLQNVLNALIIKSKSKSGSLSKSSDDCTRK